MTVFILIIPLTVNQSHDTLAPMRTQSIVCLEEIMRKFALFTTVLILAACNTDDGKPKPIAVETAARALTSCSGDDVQFLVNECVLPNVSPGPQGPMGLQGDPGPQGPAGACPAPSCPAGMTEIRNSSGLLVYCFEILPPQEMNWVECRITCSNHGAKLVGLADLPPVCLSNPAIFGATIEKFWVSDTDNNLSPRTLWTTELSTATNNMCSSGNIVSTPIAGDSGSIDLSRSSLQYLSAPDSTSLSQTGNITVELWVNFEKLPSSTDRIWQMVSKCPADERGEVNLFYYQHGIDGTRRLVAKTGITTPDRDLEQLEVVTNFSIEQWNHVAYTRNITTGIQRLYINGELVQTRNGATTPAFDSDESIRIGTSLANPGDSFDGRIDDVRIWSVERTQSEINANMFIELTGIEPGLQANWKLNNNLTDSTRNGNTLTNNNDATFSVDGTTGQAEEDVISQPNRCMCGTEPRVQ